MGGRKARETTWSLGRGGCGEGGGCGEMHTREGGRGDSNVTSTLARLLL